MKRTRVRLLVVSKLVISGVLIGWIVRGVDLHGLTAVIGMADARFLAAGVVMMLFQVALASFRWSYIARRSGLPLGAAKAFIIFWESLFFGQFLPSSMGGDVWRVYEAARLGRGAALAAHTVIVDRVSGAIALLLVVLFGSLLATVFAQAVDVRVVLVAAGTAVAIICCLMALVALRPILARFSQRRLFSIAHTLANHIVETLSDPVVITVAVVTGALGHILAITAAWCIALALSMPITLWACLLVVPVALLFALIPITIGGWGVREGAMVAGFVHLGAGHSEAVAISLLFGGYLASIGLTGGIVWLARNARRGLALSGTREERAGGGFRPISESAE